MVEGSLFKPHTVYSDILYNVHVINFSTPRWRLSEEAVEQLAGQVTEAVTQLGNCVLIYQIFDNNVYFSCTGPGERALPRKAQDGYYHIEGKLKMADRDMTKTLVNLATPCFGLEATR